MTSNELATEVTTEANTNTSSVIGHPWRRFLARSFDQTLYGIAWAIIQYFVFRWHWQTGFITNLVESYIILAMMIAIEPALLARWGTTPGKMIMGLEIRNTDGTRLTYRQGLDRMLGVFSRGLGYGVPIYNLVRCWRSSEATLNGETLEWDEGFSYELKDKKAFRGWLLAGAYAMALVSVLFIITQAQLPVNRGELTPESYAANVNDMLSRPNRGDYGYRMNAEGKWVREDTYGRGTITYNFENPMPNHEITVENGLVTGVSFEVTRRDNNFFWSTYGQQKELMIMAFAGAQRGISGYQLIFRSGLEGLLKQQGSYTHRIGDIVITNQVEHRGYDVASEWLIPREGEEQFFHIVFNMEKVDE